MLAEVSRKSQLLNSLKVYLNNKNRLQPIIGLDSIIECVTVGTQSREPLYLCEVCVCRLSKADIRSHVSGSHHRFNYIKAWHPNLVCRWQEKWDLSEMAWPLMEMAKMLEGKEGPGDVQFLEVEDGIYQKMATHSESDAVTLIKSLRGGQTEPESFASTISLHYPVQSQRIVLLAQNQQRWSEESHKISAHTNESPSLLNANVAPTVKAHVRLKNIPTSQLDSPQTLPEPSVLSEDGSSIFDDYTGTKPLIGLFRVVECRSEDGSSDCFLCHCCRIKSNKKNIIDHLTSSSHLTNYLMERHPEQVEIMTADIEDKSQFLQSLAKKVEQEEGRGELKIVNVPESLCRTLTSKSYHWCIKTLTNEWTYTNIPVKSMDVKGPRVIKTSIRGMPEKCTTMLSKCAKRRAKKLTKRKGTDTVFNVSMPLTRGTMMLERTTFSTGSLPESPESSSADLNLIHLPESQMKVCNSDCDTGSFALNPDADTSLSKTSHLHPDLYRGGADVSHCIPERNVDACVSDSMCFNPFDKIGGTKDHEVYEERKYNEQDGYSETSSNFHEKWQNGGLFPAVSHTQDGAPYYSSERHEEGYAEWYNSTSRSEAGTRLEGSREERHDNMSSIAIQYYYQQYLQNQYVARGNRSLLTGGVWGHHDVYYEPVPYLDFARINMQTHSGDPLAHSGSVSAEPRVWCLQTEQRHLQTYTQFTASHVQAAPQSYWAQSNTYQASQINPGIMFYPNHNVDRR